MALYAFDGTWNIADTKAGIDTLQPSQWGPDASFRRETTETNVHRFCEFFGDGVVYVKGLGTRGGPPGKVLGGASGFGAGFRARAMYAELCKRYVEGKDRDIDIIGFSRGAALAIHFANLIHRYGIRDPNGPKDVAWSYRAGLGFTFRFPGKVVEPEPVIRFLGLWDTVASFGIPIEPFRNRLSRWWVTKVPPNVRRSFHAMALDEVRPTFTLVRPTPARPKGQHYEVWFRGVHANIGGGYLDRGLSDIALAWMMEMYLWTLDKESTGDVQSAGDFAKALAMLAPEPPEPGAKARPNAESRKEPAAADSPQSEERPESPHDRTKKEWIGRSLETLEPDPDGELGRPAEKEEIRWRAMQPNALVHHSVFLRTKNLLLDHYRSNRRLLRQIPKDVQAIYDPPFFYSETPHQAARRVAKEAFRHIPIRAADWLKVDGRHVVRSDHWLAPGVRRHQLEESYSFGTFVSIAAAWLMQGKPRSGLVVPPPFVDGHDKPVPPEQAIAFIVSVLTCLEDYVPALREYESKALPNKPPAPA